MKALLLAYTVSIAFASNFLLEKAWPKFFAIINFAIDTYSNTSIKKRRLAALRRRYYEPRAASEKEDEASDADSDVVQTRSRPIPAPAPHIYSAVELTNDARSASQFLLEQYMGLHSGPNNLLVEQRDSLLQSPPSPTPRRYRRASQGSSSDSDEWEDTEPEEIPDRMPISFMQRNPVGSNAGEEFSDSASEQENTEADENPISTISYYTQTTSSDLDTEGEGTGSRTSLRVGAITATEFTQRPRPSIDNWSTVRISDKSSDSGKEEERMAGSEIDSDTSSDLPRNPQQPRYHRRRRNFAFEL